MTILLHVCRPEIRGCRFFDTCLLLMMMMMFGGMNAAFGGVPYLLTNTIFPTDESAPDQESDSPADPSRPQAAVSLTDEQISQLIAELSVKDFARRQQALVRLQDLSAEQIRAHFSVVESHADGESSRQLFELLERFYTGDDPDRVNAASEIIERCTSSSRWMISEAAGELLNRQWRRRSSLAIGRLQELGARISWDTMESLGPVMAGRNGRFFQVGDQPQLQINMGKSWAGGEHGLQELERLAEVTRGENPIGELRAAVYLIDEHPLTESEVVRLKTAFGDTRVVSRGRVCLGILNNTLFRDDRGCRVGDVKANTSAFDAGIRADDVIVGVDEVEIRDFDHLVQLLRKYDVGDKVKMRIIRDNFGFPDAPPGIREFPPIQADPPAEDTKKPADAQPTPRRNNEVIITVELKGW